jgi:predicted unusual protein kinase regulating ubiquinone biosynthesis (AarF/ABC1/UbiB family)
MTADKPRHTRYYAKHPKVVAQRVLQIFRRSNKVLPLSALLLDKYVFKRDKEMRPKYAKELLDLITQLGPTAIKVGQASV